jgi:uncharacterized membrane protein
MSTQPPVATDELGLPVATALAGTPPTETGLVSADPPNWLVLGLVAAYTLALAALVFAPGGTLLDRLRTLDSGICAQLPTHSFSPANQQLPLCARNTGVYVGFTVTALMLLAAGRLRAARLPATPVAIVLGLAIAVMGFDGFNSLFLDLHLPHLYQPHNLLRLATGLGTGTAMAAFLIPVANGLVWRADDTRASFGSFGQLGAMAPVLALVFLGVVSQVPWLLYPLSLAGSAGLVTALSLVNLVIILGVSGRIARHETARQVFPVLSCAVALAIIEMLSLALLKAAALRALGAPA